MDLRVRTRPSDDVTIFEINGEVDLHSAPQLRSELNSYSDSQEKPLLLVDMAGVSFIDSTGIGVLVGALKRARERGGALAFCHAQNRVRRVFEITGLLKAIPLHESRQEGLDALRGVSAVKGEK